MPAELHSLWTTRRVDAADDSQQAALQRKLDALIKSLAATYGDAKDPKNVIAAHEDHLFVWHPQETAVYCLRLKGEQAISNIQVIGRTQLARLCLWRDCVYGAFRAIRLRRSMCLPKSMLMSQPVQHAIALVTAINMRTHVVTCVRWACLLGPGRAVAVNIELLRYAGNGGCEGCHSFRAFQRRIRAPFE